MQAAAKRLPGDRRGPAEASPMRNPHHRDGGRCGIARRAADRGRGHRRRATAAVQGPRPQPRFRETRRPVDLHGARLGRGGLPEGRADRRACCQTFSPEPTTRRRARFSRRRRGFGALFPDQAGAAAAARTATAALPAERRRPHRRGAGRAHAARRNAARQPDRAAQPAGLHRSDREGRRTRSRAISSMRCWSSTCCASAGSTKSWAAWPATSC